MEIIRPKRSLKGIVMNESIRKNVTFALMAVFMGLIALSFMFDSSLFNSPVSTASTLAKVGPYKIAFRDYDQAYRNQLRYFEQITGGKALTTQQIEQFGIKRMALNRLAREKKMLIWADQLDLMISSDEIKQSIKELPYFQTNNTFDINLYKNLLARNNFTPAVFEEKQREALLAQKAQDSLKLVAIPKGLQEDIQQFKDKKIETHLVVIKKNELRSYLKIAPKEVDEFLTSEVGKARVEEVFNQRKASLGQKEQLEARHILIGTRNRSEAEAKKMADDLHVAVNANNFEQMAKKHTEDPSGKTTGGNLNKFARGAMVPEFEKVAFSLKEGEISKPVKTQFGYHIIKLEKRYPEKIASLNDHERNLAIELIQGEKNDDLDSLQKKLVKEINEHFTQNQVAKIKQLRSQYSLDFREKLQVNLYDGLKGIEGLNEDNLIELFNKADKNPQTFQFEKDESVVIVQVTKPELKNNSTKKLALNETAGVTLKNQWQTQLQKEVMENIDKKYPTKLYREL